MIPKFILAAWLFAFSQCQPAPSIAPTNISQTQADTAKIKVENARYNYDLAQPTFSVILPESLVEISAIAYISDELMAGVQDENGIIYLFNPKTGEISDSIIFEPTGDFEGLCFVENTAWVLEAKGDLWEVSDWQNEKLRKISRHKTELKKDNDSEGLCYDAANERLLIACKESPFIDDYRKDLRAVYAFYLNTQKLNTKPILSFDIPLIRKYLSQNPDALVHSDVAKKLEKGKTMPFMPSEIAIHPQTKETYILASEGMALLIFSASGELRQLYRLDPNIFEQPEGLTFAPNGDMYISSEGRAKAATLHFYKAINN
jgi:uncharacterized protein YjiK